MRRLKRRRPDPQPQTQRLQQNTTVRRTAQSRHPSGSISPSSNSVGEQTIFFTDSGHLDLAAMDAATNNFVLPPTSLAASEGDVTLPNWGQHPVPRIVASMPAALQSWEDQNAIWQQLPLLGGELGPDNVPTGPGIIASLGDINKITVALGDGNGNHQSPQSGDIGGVHSASTSGSGRSFVALGPEVEYSVTCPRGKLKTLFHHLLEAALSESAHRTMEDDKVTLTLRLST